MILCTLRPILNKWFSGFKWSIFFSKLPHLFWSLARAGSRWVPAMLDLFFSLCHRQYNKLRNLLKDARHDCVLFANEFQQYSYLPRERGESMEKWQTRYGTELLWVFIRSSVISLSLAIWALSGMLKSTIILEPWLMLNCLPCQYFRYVSWIPNWSILEVIIREVIPRVSLPQTLIASRVIPVIQTSSL